MKDLTVTQKYWLLLMSAKDINFENEFMSKFDALCKANGVKISNTSNSRGGNSFRNEMLRKQKERKQMN